MSRRGARAERRVRRHYRLRGYRVLATNVWAGGYELDLVVRRGGTVVFCEVKEKSGTSFGHPAEMVGPEKRRRLRRAGQAWLSRHPELSRLGVRVEVAAVRGRRIDRIPAEL